MTDEELKIKQAQNESNETKVENAADYLAIVEKLKSETVAREKYEKLQEDNKRLAEAVINGRTDEQVPEKVDAKVVPDIKEIRSKLFTQDCDLNNLDYVKTALQLREELIMRGEPDPFLPIGKRISPTHQDIEAAERVATVLQECIELADGDSMLFTNELQRRTNDVRIR